MNRWICAVILALLCLAVPCDSLAAKCRTSTQPACDANDWFSFGKVVRARRHTLVLREYSFAKDADVNIVYHTTGQTEYANFKKLTDLRRGEDVVVNYVVSHKRRTIITIVKEEKAAKRVSNLSISDLKGAGGRAAVKNEK
jgi:hypothetical protein